MAASFPAQVFWERADDLTSLTRNLVAGAFADRTLGLSEKAQQKHSFLAMNVFVVPIAFSQRRVARRQLKF